MTPSRRSWLAWGEKAVCFDSAQRTALSPPLHGGRLY
jgi:hypothetical protein